MTQSITEAAVSPSSMAAACSSVGSGIFHLLSGTVQRATCRSEQAPAQLYARSSSCCGGEGRRGAEGQRKKGEKAWYCAGIRLCQLGLCECELAAHMTRAEMHRRRAASACRTASRLPPSERRRACRLPRRAKPTVELCSARPLAWPNTRRWPWRRPQEAELAHRPRGSPNRLWPPRARGRSHGWICAEQLWAREPSFGSRSRVRLFIYIGDVLLAPGGACVPSPLALHTRRRSCSSGVFSHNGMPPLFFSGRAGHKGRAAHHPEAAGTPARPHTLLPGLRSIYGRDRLFPSLNFTVAFWPKLPTLRFLGLLGQCGPSSSRGPSRSVDRATPEGQRLPSSRCLLGPCRASSRRLERAQPSRKRTHFPNPRAAPALGLPRALPLRAALPPEAPSRSRCSSCCRCNSRTHTARSTQSAQ